MLINISEAALLGMYSLSILCKNNKTILQVKEITKILGASENHVYKVMQRLLKAGMVESVRGPKGGYKIKKDKCKMNLLEIYELFDGNLETEKCPMGRKKCPFEKCLFNPVLSKFYRDFKSYLKNKKLENII